MFSPYSTFLQPNSLTLKNQDATLKGTQNQTLNGNKKYQTVFLEGFQKSQDITNPRFHPRYAGGYLELSTSHEDSLKLDLKDIFENSFTIPSNASSLTLKLFAKYEFREDFDNESNLKIEKPFLVFENTLEITRDDRKGLKDITLNPVDRYFGLGGPILYDGPYNPFPYKFEMFGER